MRIFVTGTDTDVGKTTVCSWICVHTKYAYFKPIQTGSAAEIDKATVQQLSGVRIYDEAFSFTQPTSPHLAAQFANSLIDTESISLPTQTNLIVEGAGGLLVPINERHLMIDLISKFDLPTILVARCTLGTINHTLLSIEAMRQRGIDILGVILNNAPAAAAAVAATAADRYNKDAIEFYGNVKVLACLPKIDTLTRDSLMSIDLGPQLKSVLVDSTK